MRSLIQICVASWTSIPIQLYQILSQHWERKATMGSGLFLTCQIKWSSLWTLSADKTAPIRLSSNKAHLIWVNKTGQVRKKLGNNFHITAYICIISVIMSKGQLHKQCICTKTTHTPFHSRRLLFMHTACAQECVHLTHSSDQAYACFYKAIWGWRDEVEMK